MPADLDLGMTLAELDDLARHDATSRKIPEGPLEVVVDPLDPDKGFLRLEAKGLETEEGRSLRTTYYAYMVSYGDLLEHQEKRRAALNPANDPALKMITEARVTAELGAHTHKAEKGLTEAAREIVRRCLAGYQVGELKSGGVAIPWRVETVSIEGKQRKVAHTKIVEVLRRAGLLFTVAGALLEFSAQGEYPSAAQQFEAAQKLQADAAQALGNFLLSATKTASPFLSEEPTVDTPETLESFPVASASPSHSDSTSESGLEMKLPATS